MADKEIAALSGAHLSGTRFVYVAASLPRWVVSCSATTQVLSRAHLFLSSANFGLTTAAEEVVVSGVLLGATIGAIFGSRARPGHGGHVQLGFEPDRFAYFPDIGRETWIELNIPALCVCLGGVVALRLLFCSRNEGAHAGTDRSLLESKAWCAPSSDPNVLTQSLAIMRFSQVQHGADWNDASRIDLSVRHVVVALDVVEIDGLCDAWLLI